MTSPWQSQLNLEFSRADSAARAGNQGQARVCARRAAGIAIREYLIRRRLPIPSVSAYELIKHLNEMPGIAPDLKLICDHLTLRVNENFDLPIRADLVAEAGYLCKALLPEWEESR